MRIIELIIIFTIGRKVYDQIVLRKTCNNFL